MPSNDMSDALPDALPAADRKLVHVRQVTHRGYLRADGFWDIESELVDTKSYATTNADGRHTSPGEPVHGMRVRLTLDDALHVCAAIVAMPSTPFPECVQAASPLKGLVGAVIGPGWRKQIDVAMGGVRGCTHVRELVAAAATAAYQTIPNFRRHERRSFGLEEAVARSPGHQFGKCLGWDPFGPVVARIAPQFAERKKDAGWADPPS